ncbi:MAG: hypothetical protein HQM09_09650 [Candidatus Riflebacteria bacterium]|nr:hypothetical protein [Candidatus Riflebacteria bacterium]
MKEFLELVRLFSIRAAIAVILLIGIYPISSAQARTHGSDTVTENKVGKIGGSVNESSPEPSQKQAGKLGANSVDNSTETEEPANVSDEKSPTQVEEPTVEEEQSPSRKKSSETSAESGEGTTAADASASKNGKSASEAPGSIEWETNVEPSGEIFPSLLIALATVPAPEKSHAKRDSEIIGDDSGWCCAGVKNPAPGTKVKLVIRGGSLMEESYIEGTMAKNGLSYVIFPKIAWNYEYLNTVRQTTPANITFELFLNGQSVGKKVQVVRVRSINDCPIYYYDEKEPIDLSWMFAAYVNEDHPWVDGILKSALSSKIVNGFFGYQSGDSKDVFLQVFALWDALRRKGIKYSSITATAPVSEIVMSQHVRFLDEAVKNTQANCVDGSVMFASLLRKIGIDPFLVVLPNHMFLGYYLDAEHKKKTFLETTAIGDTDPEDANNLKKVEELLSEQLAAGDPWISFKAAVKAGRAQYKEDSKKFEADDPDYQIIDIGAVREKGIMPIGYRK